MADPQGSPVFVTGATGYVGRHVLNLLAAAGRPVRALTRTSGRPSDDAVSWVTGDIANIGGFSEALNGCDSLVHCAKANHEDATSRSSLDVEGTLALWNAARQAGLRRFIHLSTISVYELPDEGTIDETAPYTTRVDAYSQTKVAVEQALLSQTDGPELGILQPGCVYGSEGGWWTGTLLDLMRRGTLLVPAHGRGIANLIHVEDLAAAVLGALLVERIDGRFIITDGRPITWGEFYDGLEATVGHSATMRLSTEECRRVAAQVRDRHWLARIRREVGRRLTGSRPVFPADDVALMQSSSRAIFRAARAAEVLHFRAARVFGQAQIG